MAILTITFAANIGLSVYYFSKKTANAHQLSLIKSIGLFALVVGMLGQFIGLYGAMSAIVAFGGEMSPKLLAEGLRISSIPSIYGMIIFAISYLIWFVLNYKSSKENIN